MNQVVFFAMRTATTSRGFVRHTRVGFLGIPDVRNVERLIREHIVGRAAWMFGPAPGARRAGPGLWVEALVAPTSALVRYRLRGAVLIP